ncbi:uncharacterized protein ACWYII_036801 [Salvelinus alpinus]|uniref:zinc finger protein 771-like isoform X1 n=1 Tax=Salvelinus alpinus TaxID=8036 RepID=UPI0039FD350A
MSKLQLLNVLLKEKLTSVPLEISVAVQKTMAEYLEEISRLKRANARLRKLLDLVFKPEIKLHRLAVLQQLSLTEEEINPEQQEWSPGLGPVESDAEESIWDSFNIITEENQTESDGESYGESESTSDYEPPSEVNADSDNSRSHKGKMDGVEKRISLSGLKPLKSKRGRGRPRKETSELPDLICDVCGKCLANERSLKRHRQSRHNKDRPYMCDTCGHCFAMNCSLRRHMKIHMEERQHGCNECGKRFFHKKSLKNHMDTHKGLVFKCDFCGKCVTTKASLKLHRRIHTGEKSHPCKECDKAFYRESDLIKHTRTHTGEKPFRCKECGRCFVEKGTLTKHMMTHTEEKPHRCNKCGRCFGLKGNLTVHMRTHTGEGVQCHLCGTHLKLASSLKRHLQTHRRNIHNNAHSPGSHSKRTSSSRPWCLPTEQQGELPLPTFRLCSNPTPQSEHSILPPLVSWPPHPYEGLAPAHTSQSSSLPWHPNGGTSYPQMKMTENQEPPH